MVGLMVAFVRRDYLSWTSYRFASLSQGIGAVLLLVLLFMFGKTLGSTNSGALTQYHTDYAGFLMTSLTFVETWSVGFVLSRSLRENQATGTLEAMMLSRYGIIPLLLGSAAFPALRALAQLIVFVVVAVTAFGLWHHVAPLSAIVIFLAGLLAMGCLGILSTSFVLVIKRGDPIFAAYVILSGVLSGAVFPRQVLPQWLQDLSWVLPLTSALEGMRQALNGAGLAQIAPQVLILIAMFIFLLPATVWTLRWAMARAKEEGSLVQY